MNTYQPYFYIIQDLISLRYYAGSRYKKNANPNELLKEGGYLTSSQYIHELIANQGIKSFRIVKLRTFKDGMKALEYETRFLKRVNAAHNPKFINLHNNDGMIVVEWSDEKINRLLSKRKQTIAKLKDEFSNWNEVINKKKQNTLMEKYGVPHNSLLLSTQQKRKQTNLEKYGCENSNQTLENRQRISKNMRSRIWIKKGPLCKMVKEEELEIHYADGWVRGRNYRRS